MVLFFIYIDSYTTSDIVYEWIPDEVQFGNKELSQFQLKGSELTSKIDIFSTGKHNIKRWQHSLFPILYYFISSHNQRLRWRSFYILVKDDVIKSVQNDAKKKSNLKAKRQQKHQQQQKTLSQTKFLSTKNLINEKYSRISPEGWKKYLRTFISKSCVIFW